MLQGSATFLAPGEQSPLGPGDLLLLPPGVEHAIRWDEQRTSRHGYVHFTLGRRHRPAVPILHRAGKPDPIDGLLRYLLWLGGGTAEWEPRAAQVVDLLVTLVSTGPLPERSTARHPGLAAALGFVSEQWGQMPLRRLRLDELARAASVSPTLLHRLFRTEFGLAPSAALEGARLFRARALLLETSLGVETIGLACGFADAPHLSHRCRSVLGVSPRELRAGADVPIGDGVQRLVATLWSGAADGLRRY
jgi:AraC-like DNA-binding protein